MPTITRLKPIQVSVGDHLLTHKQAVLWTVGNLPAVHGCTFRLGGDGPQVFVTQELIRVTAADGEPVVGVGEVVLTRTSVVAATGEFSFPVGDETLSQAGSYLLSYSTEKDTCTLRVNVSPGEPQTMVMKEASPDAGQILMLGQPLQPIEIGFLDRFGNAAAAPAPGALSMTAVVYSSAMGDREPLLGLVMSLDRVHQEDRVILQNIAAFASALHSQGLPVFAGQAASTSELEIPVVAAQIHINAYTFVRGLLTIPVQLRPGPPVGLIITSGNVVLLSDNAFRGKVTVCEGQMLAPLELRCVDQYGDLTGPTQDLGVSARWACPLLACDVGELSVDAGGILRIPGFRAELAGESALEFRLVLVPTSKEARLAVEAAGVLLALVLAVRVLPAAPAPAPALLPGHPPVAPALPPRDILIKILEMCDIGDLPSLCLVNTALRDAVHAAGIELRPVGERLDTSERVRKLRMLFPYATSLDLSRSMMSDSHPKIFLDLCSAFSGSLARLNLYGCNWVMNIHAAKLARLHLPNLKSLNLGRCTRIYAPLESLEGLTRLTGLEQLNLSAISFIALPAGMTSLVSLRELDVSWSSLKALPENLLFSLTKLQKLSLGGSGLEALPDGLGGLSLLTSFKLRGCTWDIETVPSEIGNLSLLLSLDLSGCRAIEVLPEGVWGLTRLQSLKLWETGLVELPQGVSRLLALRTLTWSLHRHADAEPPVPAPTLPEGLGLLSSLETLSMCGGKFLSLPAGLGNAVALRKLCMTRADQLQSIPETIGGLSELRLLDLSGCSALTGLPESLTKLGALVRLNLLGCSNLSSLPGKFSQLSSLQVLQLTWELESTLPRSVFGTSSLRILELHCKHVTHLPQGLARLAALQELDLADSVALVALPDSLSKLSSLHTLNLENCRSLRVLPQPKVFSGLPLLRRLILRGAHNVSNVPSWFRDEFAE